MSKVDELLRQIKQFEHTGKLSASQRNTIGKALDEIQTLLPRGDFGPWIAQNLWFSYGMSSYYMKCYRDQAIVNKYEQTSKNNPFAHNPSSSPSDDRPDNLSMTAEDYKKLVTYMRDNVTLTEQNKALTKRLEQNMKMIDVHLQRIRALQTELEQERNHGGSPFEHLFGGGAAASLSKTEYRQVISALHPDKAMSDAQREAFTRATQIINQKLKAH